MSEYGDKIAKQVWVELKTTLSRTSLPMAESVWSNASVPAYQAVPDEEISAFSYPFQIVSLTSAEAWTSFYLRMAYAATTNLGPWRRILGVLRGLGAVVCVVERNYACLDFRSEVATFYSQLDQAVTNRSMRLHFFQESVSSASLFSLSQDQRKSYLGYVVCRSAGLPLVGRSVIRAPSYIEESAAIDDTVYFFGQRLSVTGVPFLQQDDRFAVCAQVAAWEANYSAYKRGLVARSLIADFVTPEKGFRPMRPGGQRGLVANQVADLLWESGLRSEVWYTPRSGGQVLPHLDPGAVPPSTLELARRTLDELAMIKARQDNRSLDELSSTEIARAVEQAQSILKRQIRWDDVGLMACDLLALAERLESEPSGVINLLDLVIAYACQPYIRSRFPIYCDTQDHAMLLCGLSWDETGPVFYFHDDQMGPYLASRVAYMASKSDFQYQAGLLRDDGVANAETPADYLRDRAHEIIKGQVSFESDDRGIHSLVVPCPSRLLLSPASAEGSAMRLLEGAGLPPEMVAQRRVSMMMGTDYKESRLSAITRRRAPERGLLASMHLAEWVVVVEGFAQDDLRNVLWEVVFDGTSGSSAPVLQFVRHGADYIYVPPERSHLRPRISNGGTSALEESVVVPQVQTLNLKRMSRSRPIQVLSRVTKGRSADDDRVAIQGRRVRDARAERPSLRGRDGDRKRVASRRRASDTKMTYPGRRVRGPRSRLEGARPLGRGGSRLIRVT